MRQRKVVRTLVRYCELKLALLAILVAMLTSAGCVNKHKALVSAHAAVGELLISTKMQATTLHTQKIIDEQTYESIRVNWLRAQTSYLVASDILNTIIASETADITAYMALITQVSTILSDIAIWMEDKNQ